MGGQRQRDMRRASGADAVPRSITIYTTDRQAVPTLIVEAVFLVTRVPVACLPGNAAPPGTQSPGTTSPGTLTYRTLTRPVYVSSTAAATGFLNGLQATPPGAEETLHRFVGTQTGFQVVLRIVGPRPERGLRLSLHEAMLGTAGVATRQLFVEFMGVFYPGAEPYLYAGALAPVPTPAEAGGGLLPRLRLQIVDQYRRVLFARSWHLEAGQLNSDAVSWLENTHVALGALVPAHDRLALYPDEADAGAPPAEALRRRKSSGERRESLSAQSLAGSFVNLDEADRVSLGRAASSAASIGRFAFVDGAVHGASRHADRQDTARQEPGTVDMLQRLGIWLYGSLVGQFFTGHQGDSFSRDAVKTFYSPAPLWLMGREYRNDAMPGPRIFALTPIASLIYVPSMLHTFRLQPRTQHDHPAISPGTPSPYVLRESFMAPPLHADDFLAHLSHFLTHGCGWTVSTSEILARGGDTVQKPLKGAAPSSARRVSVRFSPISEEYGGTSDVVGNETDAPGSPPNGSCSDERTGASEKVRPSTSNAASGTSSPSLSDRAAASTLEDFSDDIASEIERDALPLRLEEERLRRKSSGHAQSAAKGRAVYIVAQSPSGSARLVFLAEPVCVAFQERTHVSISVRTVPETSQQSAGDRATTLRRTSDFAGVRRTAESLMMRRSSESPLKFLASSWSSSSEEITDGKSSTAAQQQSDTPFRPFSPPNTSTVHSAALAARTVFVDVVSEVMALCAAVPESEGLQLGPGPGVQVVYREAVHCSIELGPHPSSLAQMATQSPGSPGAHASATSLLTISAASLPDDSAHATDAPPSGHTIDNDLVAGLDVLLWSEHIGDWISRQLRITMSDEKHGHAQLSISAPGASDSAVGLLCIDACASTAFFFADSTLRFAISVSASTWLCLRALDVDDFTLLLSSLPGIMRFCAQSHRMAFTDMSGQDDGAPDDVADEEASAETAETYQHSETSSVVLKPATSPATQPSPLSLNSFDGEIKQKLTYSQEPSVSASPAVSQQGSSTEAAHHGEAHGVEGMAQFVRAWESRFWFTYRRGFPRLGSIFLASDAGFGCMIRAGQSMMAEALAAVVFGRRRDWTLGALFRTHEGRAAYESVLRMFADTPDEVQAPFSLHGIVRVGAHLGTPVGQHFGPSTLGRALRRQCDAAAARHAAWKEHMALNTRTLHGHNTIDGGLYISPDLRVHRESGRLDDAGSAAPAMIYPSTFSEPPHMPLRVLLWRQGVLRFSELHATIEEEPHVVLMPLRLGADTLNEDAYGVLIRAALSCPQTLGIIGGRANRAYYILGYQESSLLYLDPHVVRPAVSPADVAHAAASREYHCSTVCELSLADLDPTVLLCFLCMHKADVHALETLLAEVPLPLPIFSFE